MIKIIRHKDIKQNANETNSGNTNQNKNNTDTDDKHNSYKEILTKQTKL